MKDWNLRMTWKKENNTQDATKKVKLWQIEVLSAPMHEVLFVSHSKAGSALLVSNTCAFKFFNIEFHYT